MYSVSAEFTFCISESSKCLSHDITYATIHALSRYSLGSAADTGWFTRIENDPTGLADEVSANACPFTSKSPLRSYLLSRGMLGCLFLTHTAAHCFELSSLGRVRDWMVSMLWVLNDVKPVKQQQSQSLHL